MAAFTLLITSLTFAPPLPLRLAGLTSTHPSALSPCRVLLRLGDAVPSPSLLQSKRPLGAKNLSTQSTSWLAREMRWLAQNYLLTIEQETLGFISVGEEAELIARMQPRFSLSALQLHLQRRLDRAPPQGGHADRVGAEIAARHGPTVWAAFQLAVQTRLQQRSNTGEIVGPVFQQQAGGADRDWRSDVEWVLLGQIRGGVESSDRARKPAPSKPSGKDAQVQGKRSDAKVAAGGKSRRGRGEASGQGVGRGGGRGVGRGRDADRGRGADRGQGVVTRALKSRDKSGSGRRPETDPKAKQPLGKKEVGAATFQWLGHATERLATEYLGAYDEMVGKALYDELMQVRADIPAPHLQLAPHSPFLMRAR